MEAQRQWRGQVRLGWWRPGPSYRWLVLAALTVLMAVSGGLRWTVGAFLPAWQQTFGADSATVSVAASLGLLVYGLGQPLVGRAVDRFGPRPVQATGALCLGMALLATARAPSPAVVDGVYGVLGGIGFAALAQVTAAATIQPWFSDRRGLAIGVANAGNSLGMLILGPLALFLIARWGWRATDWWFGVGVLALLLPLVGGVLRAPAGAAPAADRSERPPAWAALRHPLFLRLAIPYFVCGYTTNGLMGPHFVSFLDDDGFAVPVVAAAVGIMGGANILGTVAAGALSDRMPPGRLLALIYGVRGATLLALLATRADWLIVGLSGLYGLLDYATVPPTAALALAGFGRSLGNRGAALGYALVVMAHQLGAAVSSLVGGVLVDATGGYLAVFALAASLLVVAASVSAGIRALPTTVAGRA